MLGMRYVSDVVRGALTKEPWQHEQFERFFPLTPRSVYRLMERAGFSPEAYRNSWWDLKAALPTDEKASEHFLQFLDFEVRFPRAFPIAVRAPGLREVGRTVLMSRLNRARILRALLQANIDYNADCVTSEQFWTDAFGAISSVGTPMVTFGDSHSLIYRQTVHADGRIAVPLGVFCGGGSAAGLANPTSRSGYGRRLERITAAIAGAFERRGAPVPVCFAFGQVDMEFVFNFRRVREGVRAFSPSAMDEFTATAADTYLRWISDRVPLTPTILGINPPCLDNQFIASAYAAQMRVYVKGGVADLAAGSTLEEIEANLDALDFPAKRERTAYHAKFNAALRSRCAERGFAYHDCFAELLGPDGCIEPQFACALKDGTLQEGATGIDIHVGGEPARQVKARLLDEVARASAPTR